KTDLLAYLLSRFEDVVPLATAHGWMGDSWREWIYYAADRKLLSHFPCVIAVSRDIRDTLLRAGSTPERLRLIPNAIDPDLFHRDRAREATARAALGVGS